MSPAAVAKRGGADALPSLKISFYVRYGISAGRRQRCNLLLCTVTWAARTVDAAAGFFVGVVFPELPPVFA